jgi:methylisocitrate lyase
MSPISPGKRFRNALKSQQPLQIFGTPNVLCALMAKDLGAQAIYLSGGAISAVSYGIPDLGITSLNDVLVDVNRITSRVDTPLIVDIDTGFGGTLNIENTIHQMIRSGAAGIHIEDQIAEKRCGHRPNKALVSVEEMSNRVTVASRAKTDPDFFIIARTDAFASEGLEASITRAQAYEKAGADAIFAEALPSLEAYQAFCRALKIPVLANITEFGKTPLFTTKELASAGVQMVLYPFAAARMMNRAAEKAYKTLLSEGTQQSLIPEMQTREELYHYIEYHQFEDRLDKLIQQKEQK